MARVIDTSVCVELERRAQLDIDLATLAVNETLAITTGTAAELLVGVELRRTPAVRLRSQLAAENLLQRIDLLVFDLEAARIYANVGGQLQNAGLWVGGFDLQIAAIAIANQSSVVTLNLREFSRIAGLTVRTPGW